MPPAFTNFHPAVASWFQKHLGSPTRIQERSWPVLAAGGHALISAPTGSGKTLAAFLSILNDLFVRGLGGDLPPASTILYISPLKALSNDIEKNLQVPLSGIALEMRAMGIETPDVRVMVRTGDSTASHRARMLRDKPHVIVTTPESLYVLLTSESGRKLLSTVETVIVDEIHAVVANRRGAHLSLSIERLERITQRKLQRIGISATVRPLERVAEFLAPNADVTILHEGHHRQTDIRMILPAAPLDAVMTQEAWADVNKQIVAAVQSIRTCLIFVNNRRLCERLSRQLSELLGDDLVGAHHGSLSYPQRLRAETALKDGRLKVMVATSSLELGIDIGSIDLVIQIASPRTIHGFLQRIGRSEHRHDGVSRAVVIPLTRDDLMECAAVLCAMKTGALEEIQIPEAPLDVLAQQIVAEVSAGEVGIDDLYKSLTQSYPYRHLKRERFEEILGMLADGYTMRFGRRSRYLFYDRSRGILQARKGARLSAITNGGAIPDSFEYEVILEDENAFLGTVHEDFAIESIAGDVFQLGNQFWRIRRISTGKVMVAAAPGATPTMPFWIAEAPGRTTELSRAVSDLRGELGRRLTLGLEGFTEYLETAAGLPSAASSQIFDYMRETEKALGVIPTQSCVVMERFFDEAGDCHIVIHSPYGTRINRAWGLALRKRFCRKFNFELQAAASDDAVLFSLSKTHSFALADVFSYVKRAVGESLLKQAVLASPMFEIRWRWNASRSLAILRQYGGKRTPPQIQKSQAQDLVALVFPDQIACAENIAGDRQIPNHPLVDQTIDDCMHEAMDLPGWLALLGAIETSAIETRSVDTAAPSLIAHEILNARPYAFLDDAPLEERRSRAVRTDMRPVIDEDSQLPEEAVMEQVRRDSQPSPRDLNEFYDLLTTFGILLEEHVTRMEHPDWMARLMEEQRVAFAWHQGRRFIIPADRFAHAALLVPGLLSLDAKVHSVPALTHDRALDDILRGHLELIGPVTVGDFALRLPLDEATIAQALVRYETEGWMFRIGSQLADVWCERSFWQRMQFYRRRYAGRVECTPDQYMSFLVRWQHAHPDTRLEGPAGVEAALTQLEGCSMPVEAWHKALSRRVSDFQPSYLDHLFLTGVYVWWRPARSSDMGRRSITRNVPVMIVSRELMAVLDVPDVAGLSHYAKSVYVYLKENGASFLTEIQTSQKLLSDHIRFGLKELIARGLVTSDSLTALSSLFQPRRAGYRASRSFTPLQLGRWSLFKTGRSMTEEEGDLITARLLLRRYGLISRYFAEREFLNRPWSRLVRTLRRLEMQGEVRGGRFIKNIWGEQFVLPQAYSWMESLFASDNVGDNLTETLGFETTDPVHLAGAIRTL